jgi:hypothetical protein
MAVGARAPLIAFNVNLATEDLAVARKIAKAVRGSDGGLLNVKALGLELKSRRQTQVSMNLTDYEETPIFRAFEMVKLEAARYGAPITGCEIVGLVPQAALNACSEFYLQIEDFGNDLILERRIQAEMSKLEPGFEYEADVVSRKPSRPGVFSPPPHGVLSPSPHGVFSMDDMGDDSWDVEGDDAGDDVAPDGASAAAKAGELAAALGDLSAT